MLYKKSEGATEGWYVATLERLIFGAARGALSALWFVGYVWWICMFLCSS